MFSLTKFKILIYIYIYIYNEEMNVINIKTCFENIVLKVNFSENFPPMSKRQVGKI